MCYNQIMPESPEGPNAGREGYKDFGGRGFGVWKKYEEMLNRLLTRLTVDVLESRNIANWMKSK